MNYQHQIKIWVSYSVVLTTFLGLICDEHPLCLSPTTTDHSLGVPLFSLSDKRRLKESEIPNPNMQISYLFFTAPERPSFQSHFHSTLLYFLKHRLKLSSSVLTESIHSLAMSVFSIVCDETDAHFIALTVSYTCFTYIQWKVAANTICIRNVFRGIGTEMKSQSSG